MAVPSVGKTFEVHDTKQHRPVGLYCGGLLHFAPGIRANLEKLGLEKSHGIVGA